jgi:hypothetical protein
MKLARNMRYCFSQSRLVGSAERKGIDTNNFQLYDMVIPERNFTFHGMLQIK